jgi:outer membrane receptor for monomeric catechols
MKITTPLPYVLLGLALAIPFTGLNAQDQTDGSDDSVFELSPFEVDGSQDSGYLAANTLAGSRLNTSLEDVSAVIDVFTKEFMEDVGATELEDVVGYANNLVRDTEDARGGVGNIPVQAETSFNFRIRGLNASRTRNYFSYLYPFDTYSIERFDESRGPNAILFGFGSPGGIINSSTKRANFGRKVGYMKFSTGTEMDSRFELDVNKVIIDDVLAVRLNALYQEETGWKSFTYDDREGYLASVTVKPFEKTKIFLDFESYKSEDAKSRQITHYARSSKWTDAGSPLLVGGWDARKNASLNPDLTSEDLTYMKQLIGTKDANNDGWWVLTDNDESLLNWRGMARAEWPKEVGVHPDGGNLTFFNGGREMVLDPEGLIEVNVMGPGAFRDFEVQNWTAVIQQEVTKDLHIELAATKNEANWYVISAFASTREGDPNVWLPKGSATNNLPDADAPVLNPYAGLDYFDTTWGMRTEFEETTSLRATASYELNLEEKFGEDRLGWFLGKHRFAALYEDSEYTIEENLTREQVMIDGSLPRPDLPNDNRNRLYRRHYVTDPTNPEDYINGDLSRNPVPFEKVLEDGSVLTTDWFAYDRRWDYTRDIESKMVAMQNFWMGGKFVTTLGKRWDDVEFAAYEQMNDGIGGVVRDPDSLTVTPYKGNTILLGSVYHVTDRLSLFYNQSESIGVPELPIRYVPDGRFNDVTTGEGKDFGVKLSLFDGQIYLLATRFEASQNNETALGGVENWAVARQDRIVNALLLEGFIDETEAAANRIQGTGYTSDSETDGYELSLVGRLGRSWSIRLNYSWTDRNVENVAPRVQAWADEMARPFWNSFDRVNPNDESGGSILDTVFTGSNSIRDEMENFEDSLSQRVGKSERVVGLRRHKTNLFVSYAFKEGRFKGVTLGAGARYIGKPVVTQDLDGADVYGSDNLSFDFLAKYRTKLWKTPFTFQVNVRNAFRDHAEWSTINILYDDNIDAIVVFPPREVIFSVRMDF